MKKIKKYTGERKESEERHAKSAHKESLAHEISTKFNVNFIRARWTDIAARSSSNVRKSFQLTSHRPQVTARLTRLERTKRLRAQEAIRFSGARLDSLALCPGVLQMKGRRLCVKRKSNAAESKCVQLKCQVFAAKASHSVVWLI